MGEASAPVAPSAPLSTTAIAAIATGIGISLICIIALIILLMRAVRNHKQLLADLEERGVSVAHAQGEARRSVARPRTVLRRNTVLPYHKNSGWGTLTSVETITSSEGNGVVAHYVPPKPTEAARKASRLSWPFHTRRVSGHNIHLKKIKGSRLSTVLEDPKPSALVPILDSSHLNASRPSLAGSSYHEGRPSSSQSLLQYHPAFRSSPRLPEPAHQQRSDSGSSFFRAGANERLQRAKSFADVPSVPPVRPQLRVRSASVCSHASGRAPDVILPPLPLDIVRIKSEAKRRSQLRRIPSKQSESSFGSVDTSILAGVPSPVVPQVAKRRPQKITKPRTRGSTPRDSLDLRAKVLGLLHTPNGKSDWTSVSSLDRRDPYTVNNSTPSEVSNSQDLPNTHRAMPVVTQTPPTSPHRSTGPTTPKRKLRSQAYSEGSPERYKRSTATSRVVNGAIRSPKRQHSQTSSRSSGGNPFQWDPAPLFSTGKPSALKGSPSARQGHRRKNSVRISLVPTFHGPPTRTPSPSFLVGSKDDTTEGATARRPVGLGLAVPRPRSLPTPPSSSTFAPELKFPTTSLRASLTLTSPTLPLNGYDQPYVVFPTDQVMSDLAKLGEEQQDDSTILSSSLIPGPPSIIEPATIGDSPTMTTATTGCQNLGHDRQVPETPYLPQSPFRPETPDYTQFQCYTSLIDFDGYDSERQSMGFQTPANTSSRIWQSAFATIPEEASVSSQRTVDVDTTRCGDSPPLSPLSLSSLKFSTHDRSAYSLPIHATTIPEETQDTIDPAILSKDSFALLNSSIKNIEDSIMDFPSSPRPSLALVIPETPDMAELAFEPLLEAAFPHEPRSTPVNSSPILGHHESEASSVYSLPSPLPSLSPTTSVVEMSSPIMPCSPRPSHAQLPTVAPSVSIDFSDLPKLAPSPLGPRRSPPRPLRTSIAALRRMNSDAAKRKKDRAGRGERRYLRLGREDSVPLPGDESWLDEMEDTGSPEASEADITISADHASQEWDEGRTILDLEEGSTMETMSTITPDTELYVTAFETNEHEDSMAGAEERASSIWDDGEKFWTSPTPPRPMSPQRSKGHYKLPTPSPLASPAWSGDTSTPAKASKKRDFEVAKDSSPTAPSPTKGRSKGRNRKKRRESLIDDNATAGASSTNRKERSVLGNGTPNVKIQVTSPSGEVVTGLPGSLYDSQGFLRY
jgi:hypothetical protein